MIALEYADIEFCQNETNTQATSPFDRPSEAVYGFYEALCESAPFEKWPGEQLADDFIKKVDRLSEAWTEVFSVTKPHKAPSRYCDIVHLWRIAQQATGSTRLAHLNDAMVKLDQLKEDRAASLRSIAFARKMIDQLLVDQT